MREMTYRGFLERYVRRLSACGCGSMRKLAREVEQDRNERLAVPLVLLAYHTERCGLVRVEAVPGGLLAPELERVSSFGSQEGLQAAMAELRWEDGPLPTEYYKVWESFLARRGRYDERSVKAAMRDRVLAARKVSGESLYRMAKSTGLNQGAVGDFVNRGMLSRLGTDSLDRLVAHAEAEAGDGYRWQWPGVA